MNIKFVDNIESAKYYDALPSFSKEIYDFLYSEEVGMSEDSVIADLGCGTGRMTIDFLKRGNIVYAIDPDENMRKVCGEKCSDFNKLKLIEGTEENFGVPDNSVDYVVSSQSFHKFNNDKFKKECNRVLKNKDNVIIIWYRVSFDRGLFKEMLDNLKKNYKDYETRYGNMSEVEGAKIEEIENNKSANKFLNNKNKMKEIINKIYYSKEQFITLGLSLSLFPITHRMNTVTKILAEDSFNSKDYINGLEEIFSKYQKDNKIEIPLRVQIHYVP